MPLDRCRRSDVVIVDGDISRGDVVPRAWEYSGGVLLRTVQLDADRLLDVGGPPPCVVDVTPLEHRLIVQGGMKFVEANVLGVGRLLPACRLNVICLWHAACGLRAANKIAVFDWLV